MTLTRSYIHEATGFDNGDLFTSEEQVREYFTVDNMRAMFGECNLSQAELDEMAEAVIANRWHMALPSDDPDEAKLDPRIREFAQDLFALYRRKLADSLECGEDELPAVTARLADEDFETLAAAQNAAEEAAWAEARQADPEWPRPWSDEEAAVAEAFQRLGMEAGGGERKNIREEISCP